MDSENVDIIGSFVKEMNSIVTFRSKFRVKEGEFQKSPVHAQQDSMPLAVWTAEALLLPPLARRRSRAPAHTWPRQAPHGAANANIPSIAGGGRRG